MNETAANPVVVELRARIQRFEGGRAHGRAVLPFGIKEIDRHLPGGGLALGALHEVAGGGNGAIDGAAAALFAAGIAARTRGKILWCVARQDLFAPALAQAGLPPDRVMPPCSKRASGGRGPRSSTGHRRSGRISRSALNVPGVVHQPQAGLPQCPW